MSNSYGEMRRRVRELAMIGYVPAAIEAETGFTGSEVRAELTLARKDGLDIPRHSPSPIKPVMPASCAPCIANVRERRTTEAKIRTLASEGVPMRQIAARLSVSFGYVQRVLRRKPVAAK